METAATIADAVAAHYNAQTGKPFDYNATRPKTKAAVIAEQKRWSVFVIPERETETPIDHADSLNNTIHVRTVVNGPCKDMADGLAIAKFLRLSLAELNINGYRFEGNEVLSLWDAEALEKRGQFLCMFESEFYDVI